MRELARRSITQASFRADTFDVGELVGGTRYYPLAKALQENLARRAGSRVADYSAHNFLGFIIFPPPG
jgi:hypothetical protein